MVPLSILDLAPIVEGGDAGLALKNTLDLAQHAERWNYRRFWLAEHHNMPGIASAATAVVIAHVAAGTSTIRVGAGGIMLPNHAPLVVAEQFGTLAALHPGRIDLGLGRAPGTDQPTMRALRRTLVGDVDAFPVDVLELQSYFDEPKPGQHVRAIPGAGIQVPIWILGSSLYGAELAAKLGLPYSFASHFAPDQLEDALALYRREFRPSRVLSKPQFMFAMNAFAADDEATAQKLATSMQQQFVALRRGTPGKLQPPVDTMEGRWLPHEKAGVARALSCSVIGDRTAVKRGLARFVERYAPDEIIVTGHIYGHAARLRSFEIVAEVAATL
jgi:luciferase family oxidoreductase group 1